ncbi:MAG: glycosyltransferase family 4 protein [Alphaproteobacteria bacterium]
MSGARVFVVGPYPPPVHGAAMVTAAIADRLEAHVEVRRCDISPGRLSRGPVYHLRRVWRVLAATAAIAENVGRPGCVYISAAGGSGLLYNLALAAVARLLRQRVFVHHHSFAYLDRDSAIMRLLTKVAGSAAVHVALCPRMAARLRERYPAVARHMVLSNAAFHPPAAGMEAAGTGALRLGHMGNLSDEKGLDLVLELFREASSSGLAARLVLAGPPADETAARAIAAAREVHGDGLDYRGPVYGEDKDRFFADIDLFLFPTRYVNEAEPIVLFEAMARGVPVIAYERGCIAEQLGEGAAAAGIVVPPQEPFVRRAAAGLRELAQTPDRLAAARRAASARMARLHDEAATQIEDVLRALAGQVT